MKTTSTTRKWRIWHEGDVLTPCHNNIPDMGNANGVIILLSDWRKYQRAMKLVELLAAEADVPCTDTACNRHDMCLGCTCRKIVGKDGAK